MALDATSLSMGGLAVGVQDNTQNAQNSLNDTYSQFLTLLTTQLKNQDPLNPMDSKDFTSQLIGLAQTEQSIAQSSKLDELIKLNQTSAINSSLLGYIGMNVNYQGNQFTYAGGQQIQFSYTLPSDAATNKVSILDDKNNVVWSSDGETTTGDHTLLWPGTNNDGVRVAAGAYHIQFDTEDASAQPIATTTPVTNFNFSDGASSMSLQYNLASAAKTAKASVFDSNNKLVWSANVDLTAGDHTVVWPGTDQDGKPVSAGNYSIQVGAADADNKSIVTTTTVPAVVGGIDTSDGTVKLVIGNQKVAISDVKTVSLPTS